MPEFSFVDKDVDALLSQLTSVYEEAYKNRTGDKITLRPADTVTILLYVYAYFQNLALQNIDFAAKQNLLKYATKEYLREIGYGRTEDIKKAEYAYTTVRFNFSISLSSPVTIAKGTRITSDGSIYFLTEESVTVGVGGGYVEVICIADRAGVIGNGYAPGELNVLSDPVPFVESVANIDTSSGGADEEDVEVYRERIRIAPEGYSTAGPEGAYEYYAYLFDANIANVKVTTPQPGYVDIYVVMRDGSIPSDVYKQNLLDFIYGRRPMTDYVATKSPDFIQYDINVSYYISKSKETLASSIKQSVESAVNDYILWQKTKIGRDIDPSELIKLMKNAGASRVALNMPLYTPVEDTEVAQENEVTINYGGIEDE